MSLMTRLVAISALAAAVLIGSSAYGQRGGGMRGGFAGHASGMSGSHGMGISRPGFGGARVGFAPARGFSGPRMVHGPRFRGNGFFGGFRNRNFRFTFGHSCWANPIFCRGRFGRRFFPWYAGYYPFAYYPYDGLGYDYRYEAQPTDSSVHVPTPTSYNEELQASVESLSNQVADLREELVRQREVQSSPANPPNQDKSTPTVLIFHDGRRIEAENYAVAGKTLWIFNELRARKYPVSDLNMEATRNANEERGLSFVLPEP